jgi:hypothetical protein
MPSTLEVIDELAFLSADISVLDFADCKLEYVEENAFFFCETETKRIPDSIRTIRANALYFLKIGDGKTIKLPSSLRYIGRAAMKFSDASIVEADERTVASNSGLCSSIISSYHSCEDERWLLMKVFREKRLVLEFVISSEFKALSELANLIEENKVNFELYDEWFDKIHNKQCKLEMARLRVKWPIDLSADLEIKYISYLALD